VTYWGIHLCATSDAVNGAEGSYVGISDAIWSSDRSDTPWPYGPAHGSRECAGELETQHRQANPGSDMMTREEGMALIAEVQKVRRQLWRLRYELRRVLETIREALPVSHGLTRSQRAS
jgi:hypothetical protein